MKTDLQHPVLITGASNGIGYATSLLMSRQGYKVIALSRDEAKLKRLKEEAGENLVIVPFDLMSDDYSPLTTVLHTFAPDGIHGIIHNAGLLISKHFDSITVADMRNIYEINVFAPYRLTQFLLPWLKKASPAHVVMISSMGGVQGSVKFPGLSAYSSSKGALCTLTECLL